MRRRLRWKDPCLAKEAKHGAPERHGALLCSASLWIRERRRVRGRGGLRVRSGRSPDRVPWPTTSCGGLQFPGFVSLAVILSARHSKENRVQPCAGDILQC